MPPIIPPGPAWPALALLRTGENPLWFEFGAEGPSLIDHPSAATLTPYTPWPHARFVTGMQTWEGFLVMAVNRDGFIILGPGSESGELVLYRVTDSALWDLYTAESFFIWDGRPTVLLYQNNFFSAPAAYPLPSLVFSLSKLHHAPLPTNINAFDSFLQNWDAEVVRQGPGGHWYFRMIERAAERRVTAYFRTPDLAQEGTRISVTEWRNSDPRGLGDPDESATAESFQLPALPEGFTFSAVTLFENVIVASWEEQRDASIAAAGFMVMAL